MQVLHSQVEMLEVSIEKQPLSFRGVQCTVHRVFIARKEVNSGERGSVSLNNIFMSHLYANLQSMMKKS